MTTIVDMNYSEPLIPSTAPSQAAEQVYRFLNSAEDFQVAWGYWSMCPPWWNKHHQLSHQLRHLFTMVTQLICAEIWQLYQQFTCIYQFNHCLAFSSELGEFSAFNTIDHLAHIHRS